MSPLPPVVVTGLLLAAIPHLSQLGLAAPTPAMVLTATGASKTTAYKVKAAIEAALPDLLRPPGRPPAPPPVAPTDRTALHRAVLAYVYAHPGAVSDATSRRSYSDGFRLFAIEQCEAHLDIELEEMAAALGIPLGTLKDWLRGERPQVSAPQTLVTFQGPAQARIETVLAAWEGWAGRFRAFCTHVWFHLRIPFGRQEISDILKAHGVRFPKRRGRPVDASAMREGFETFFPGAQWVGDGKEVVVEINGERFTVNLELNVDTDSGAFTGVSVRPTEDTVAVVEAFQDGVATTGAPPLALLLDNKPSNHTEAVDDALGDTLRMRSRPFVPTDKPHVEGAFGLFAQEAPPLVLNATTMPGLALQIATLVITAWARAVNHRPRADREGKSRAQIYRDAKPTAEEIDSARKALRERQLRQEQARKTRERRQDPVTRAMLDDAFVRLGLEDPEGHFRTALASWPLQAILAGIAVFEGKRKAGTLPEGADARYLRGIVKNIAQEDEGWHIAEALLKARLKARDLMLDHLDDQQQQICESGIDPEEELKMYVENALGCKRGIDRTFWLLATADVISAELPASRRPQLLRLAARRIASMSAVPQAERLAATRFLFAKVVVVD